MSIGQRTDRKPSSGQTLATNRVVSSRRCDMTRRKFSTETPCPSRETRPRRKQRTSDSSGSDQLASCDCCASGAHASVPPPPLNGENSPESAECRDTQHSGVSLRIAFINKPLKSAPKRVSAPAAAGTSFRKPCIKRAPSPLCLVGNVPRPAAGVKKRTCKMCGWLFSFPTPPPPLVH